LYFLATVCTRQKGFGIEAYALPAVELFARVTNFKVEFENDSDPAMEVKSEATSIESGPVMGLWNVPDAYVRPRLWKTLNRGKHWP